MPLGFPRRIYIRRITTSGIILCVLFHRKLRLVMIILKNKIGNSIFKCFNYYVNSVFFSESLCFSLLFKYIERINSWWDYKSVNKNIILLHWYLVLCIWKLSSIKTNKIGGPLQHNFYENTIYMRNMACGNISVTP